MRTVWCICIIAALFVSAKPVCAENWQTVYQTDFSSDPNWVTNDSAQNYWNEASQNYHIQTQSNAGQYVYIPVTFKEGNSYLLQFDISVARTDIHGGGILFGLGDSDMRRLEPATFYVVYWNSSFGGEQQGIRGNVLGEFYFNRQGGSYLPVWEPVTYFTMNTWYHNVLTYDYPTQTLSLIVTRRSDGSVLGTQFKTDVGTFSGIDRLYVSTISSNNDNGKTGEGYIDNVVLSTNPPPATKVSVDIKPGSCPNPLNVKSKGVLPAAILGTEDLDITTIDPTSIRLAGAAPILSSYEDVASPVSDANDCDCVSDGPDGLLDLTMKFDTQQIVQAIGDVNQGDILTLELTGALLDQDTETPIEGTDCILFVGAK